MWRLSYLLSHIPRSASILSIRHFITLLLLAYSSLCHGLLTKDKEPAVPSVDTVAATQSYYASLAAERTDVAVYICDSKTAKAYHQDEDCRGLNRCTYKVVKVTKKEYGRVKCQVCY